MKPIVVKLRKSDFNLGVPTQREIICGSRKYKNINLDKLVDSFEVIIRHNMLTPNSGYGKRNPDRQVLNCHAYDNYNKKLSLDGWVSNYQEVFGISTDHISSFCELLKSDDVDFRYFKDNNTGLMRHLLAERGIEHEIQAGMQIRCGLASVADCLIRGVKPYLVGFGMKEETSLNKQYATRNAGDECHDEFSEINLIKKLHEAGLVDATLCAIEDNGEVTIDSTLLRPTPSSLRIVEEELDSEYKCSIKQKVVAVIPARSGSKRIRNKNILPFGDTTLVENKIKQLLKCKYVDTVIVATNDPVVKEICKSYEVSVMDREDRFCDEVSATPNEMIGDIASRVDESFDIIIWSHCTNPLIRSEIYDNALNTFVLSNKIHDSLISVTEIKNHFWHKTKSGFIPLNYNPQGEEHPLASELEPLYFQDGGIFIQRREDMVSNSYFFGKNPFLFTINPYLSIDINEPLDMFLAEAINRTKV